jgi:hypothetical protein
MKLPLIRHVEPKTLAKDIVSVQPMTGPTGQIFSLRTHQYPWELTFRWLPTKVETANGTQRWAMCRKVYKKYVPHDRGHNSYYRYRLPKDHFTLELKGVD